MEECSEIIDRPTARGIKNRDPNESSHQLVYKRVIEPETLAGEREREASRNRGSETEENKIYQISKFPSWEPPNRYVEIIRLYNHTVHTYSLYVILISDQKLYD